MTLIATAINKKNIPFLISDLLISSDKGIPNFQSPTNNFSINEYLPQNSINKPESFSQKTYIINKNLCVMLAGSVYEMKNFLDDLIKYFNYHELTKTDLFNFLSSYDYTNEFKKSAYGIMLIENSNNDVLQGTFINCPELMYKIEEAVYHSGWAYAEHILGKISAIGSGRDNFFDIINENSKYTSLLADGSIEQGIQILVTLASKILMAEKATVQTILNGWGGGLELVYYDPSESTFKKIDNVAYILSQGEFNEVGDVGLPIPRLILHYKYHEDLLYITAISIFKCRKKIIDNDIEIVSEFEDYVTDLFIVPTILRKEPIILYEDWNYDFKTSLIGMGYDIRNTKSGRPFYPSAFTLHEEINVSFQHKGQVKFSIRKELTDEFRAQVNDAYPHI